MKINHIYAGPLLIGQQYGIRYHMDHDVLRVPVLPSVSEVFCLADSGHTARNFEPFKDSTYEFNPLQIVHRDGVERVGVWLPAGRGPDEFWPQFVHLAELKQMLLRALDNAPNAALEHYLGKEVVAMILKDAKL